jgi:hypothetical protein
MNKYRAQEIENELGQIIQKVAQLERIHNKVLKEYYARNN